MVLKHIPNTFLFVLLFELRRQFLKMARTTSSSSVRGEELSSAIDADTTLHGVVLTGNDEEHLFATIMELPDHVER